ncbi:HlyD family secretion protein [Hyphomicrobium sp.]|uniref:HlyD family secretion protein n=1 Tax=Hyphomicrobium sp. TaxID=82 RepID=UPI000FAB0075|nr:HlyD family secretion protein [Hyphomicrobium sp.]RUP10516.1 MAG: HlyD family secretion protein [Hyphomicrobium sp.]
MQDRLPEKKPVAVQSVSPASARAPLLSRQALSVLGVLALIALIAAGYFYWQHASLYPSTENAQVQANIVQIAPLVTGPVTEVKVHDFTAVKSGDVLVQLDRAPFEAALKLAESRLSVAQQQATAAAGPQAAAAKANVEQAQIAVDQARTDLDRTTIKAPADGTVGKVRIQPGEIAKAGMGMFPLVDTAHWWVDANFKETDLARIKPGQTATITIDAYPSQKFTGNVEAVSRASNAAFSLMPAENATGSWVKVVQRFPVRIGLTLKPEDPAIGVGASAYVIVDTAEEATSGAK